MSVPVERLKITISSVKMTTLTAIETERSVPNFIVLLGSVSLDYQYCIVSYRIVLYWYLHREIRKGDFPFWYWH